MYRIVWTSSALKHLQDILDFVITEQNSVSYAEKILAEIRETENYISKQPTAFIEVENTSEKVHRAVVLKNYSIFYSIHEIQKQCSIVCFWDNRQNPQKLSPILS